MFIPDNIVNNGLGVAIYNVKFKKKFNELKHFFKVYEENVNSVNGCWGRVG